MKLLIWKQEEREVWAWQLPRKDWGQKNQKKTSKKKGNQAHVTFLNTKKAKTEVQNCDQYQRMEQTGKKIIMYVYAGKENKIPCAQLEQVIKTQTQLV